MTRKRKTPAAIRMAAYRRRLREKLIQMLGGECVDCGTTENLEPDHLEPRQWRARDKWSSTRLLIYIDEARQVKLSLRCRKHNAMRGQPLSAEDLETCATF